MPNTCIHTYLYAMFLYSLSRSFSRRERKHLDYVTVPLFLWSMIIYFMDRFFSFHFLPFCSNDQHSENKMPEKNSSNSSNDNKTKKNTFISIRFPLLSLYTVKWLCRDGFFTVSGEWILNQRNIDRHEYVCTSAHKRARFIENRSISNLRFSFKYLFSSNHVFVIKEKKHLSLNFCCSLYPIRIAFAHSANCVYRSNCKFIWTFTWHTINSNLN